MNNDFDNGSNVTEVLMPDALLPLMRKMHAFALAQKWGSVEELNQQRTVMLDTASQLSNAFGGYSREEIQEILTLDQNVMSLTQGALDIAAIQAATASKKNSACQEYQSVSGITQNTPGTPR